MLPKDLARCMLWAQQSTESEVKEFIEQYKNWKERTAKPYDTLSIEMFEKFLYNIYPSTLMK